MCSLMMGRIPATQSRKKEGDWVHKCATYFKMVEDWTLRLTGQGQFSG